MATLQDAHDTAPRYSAEEFVAKLQAYITSRENRSDDCALVVTDVGLDLCCTVDTGGGLEVECTDVLQILKPE